MLKKSEMMRNSGEELLGHKKQEAVELFRRLRIELSSKYPTMHDAESEALKEAQRMLAQLSPRERDLLAKLFIKRETGTLSSLSHEVEAENQSIAQSPLEISSVTSTPPAGATFLLLLAPKRYREYLLGDLAEEYLEIVLPCYGIRKANLWYWWQVIISLLPILWSQAKRIATLSFLWKFIR